MRLPLKKASPDTVTVSSASSGTILAANARRRHAIIGGNQTVGLWLNFGADAAVGTGIYVPPATAFEIYEDNLWVGDVRGILASGADQVIGVMELM